MTDLRPGKRVILQGAGTAVVMGMVGFALLEAHKAPYGIVVFLLAPFAAGFAATVTTHATATVSTRAMEFALIAVTIAVISGFACLLLGGLEGLVCVLMASPLILVGLVIGIALGWLVARVTRGSPKTPTAALILLPLMLVGGAQIERELAPPSRREIIATRATFRTSAETAFRMLQSVAEVDAPRPFLMRIGLPVPMVCKLDWAGVGAKRTCYFDDGYIQEQVVAWSPPRLMKMRVIDDHVPGHHWLGFEDAIYEFSENPDGTTTVTRTTSITSELFPAFYWRPLERLGVETEHRYIFADLERRLQAQRPKR